MLQPLGAIVQTSFVVPDLETAMHHWLTTGTAGPFHVLPHLVLVQPRYRGQPTQLDISIALAYSGGVCVELVQQHDATPSVYNEHVNNDHSACLRPVFHHVAVMTEDFDGELARLDNQQAPPIFEGAVAVGGRFAYLDTREALGGLLELIELTPVVRDLFAAIEASAQQWNGDMPIRYP